MQFKRDGEVLEIPTPMPKVQKLTRRDILDRAAACVCGERGTADCFVDLAGYAACGGEVAGV